MATESLNNLLTNDFRCYQEITKGLNDYYYGMKDVVCLKFLKSSTVYSLEISVLNDEFDVPIRLRGLHLEYIEAMINNAMHDITRLVAVLKAYRNDAIRMSKNQTNTDYVTNMVSTCINSILKYEVCIMAVGDLAKPEYDLNFAVVGNLTTKEIRKGYNLTKLSVRHSVKQLYPDAANDVIVPAVKRYEKIFRDFCLIPSDEGGYLYN